MSSNPQSHHVAPTFDLQLRPRYDPNDPNQSEPILPLMHLSFNDWWFHGYINKPPAADTFMMLPSGGTYHGQVACNKALTTYGAVPEQQTGIYACDGDGATGGIGAMHTTDAWASGNPTNVKGCGIAIAYTSDEHAVQPEDFTVISTNWTCPWYKHVDFQIPSDLPACPEGGCLCSWGWIHSEDAGSEQNYHLVYRCKVDGATGVTPLPAPKTANKCNLPVDTSNCTVGAKQPHYWYQNERNNNPQGEYDPPFYNGAYGFMDGAQTDLFATVDDSSGAKLAASPESSSVPVSTASVPAAASVDSPVTTSEAVSTTSDSASSTLEPTFSVAPAASTGAAKTCRRRKRSLGDTTALQAIKRHQQRIANKARHRASRS